MTDYNKELIEIHLLRKGISADFRLLGDQRYIEKISYDKGKVFINKTTYFESITDDLWGFIVGGYQPCHRWLNERKGRILSDEDVETYISILFAIEQTIETMHKIDEIAESVI